MQSVINIFVQKGGHRVSTHQIRKGGGHSVLVKSNRKKGVIGYPSVSKLGLANPK